MFVQLHKYYFQYIKSLKIFDKYFRCYQISIGSKLYFIKCNSLIPREINCIPGYICFIPGYICCIPGYITHIFRCWRNFQFPDIDEFLVTLTVPKTQPNQPNHCDRVTFGHFGTSSSFGIPRRQTNSQVCECHPGLSFLLPLGSWSHDL